MTTKINNPEKIPIDSLEFEMGINPLNERLTTEKNSTNNNQDVASCNLIYNIQRIIGHQHIRIYRDNGIIRVFISFNEEFGIKNPLNTGKIIKIEQLLEVKSSDLLPINNSYHDLLIMFEDKGVL